MPKKCSSCKNEKPLTEFNVCKAAKDGLQSRCVACSKIHGQKYYQEHKAELNEQQKWRRSGPEAREARKKAQRRRHERQIKEDAADCAERYEERKAAKKETNERYREKLRLIKSKRGAAFHAVNQAVKSGELIRPTVCPVCSAKAFNVAHQEDYNKPLEIEWMCIGCYRKRKAE